MNDFWAISNYFHFEDELQMQLYKFNIDHCCAVSYGNHFFFVFWKKVATIIIHTLSKFHCSQSTSRSLARSSFSENYTRMNHTNTQVTSADESGEKLHIKFVIEFSIWNPENHRLFLIFFSLFCCFFFFLLFFFFVAEWNIKMNSHQTYTHDHDSTVSTKPNSHHDSCNGTKQWWKTDSELFIYFIFFFVRIFSS